MGVLDGQAVNQAVTNPAFINKNQDDVMPNKLGLARPLSGTTVADAQAAINKLYSATGASEVASGTVYSAPAGTITDGDTHQLALEKIADKFDSTTGHDHSGNPGNGAQIDAQNLKNVPLRGYVKQGTDLSAVTGGSVDVSSQFTLETPSTSQTQQGIVVNSPYNKIILRDSSLGTEFKDSAGNIVYGRLTYAASVWTLSFFSDVSGTETAYSFASSANIRFYYQKLTTVLSPFAPIYSEMIFVPSDNATADIVPATTTQQGKVQLGTSAQPVSSASSAGTANATVANADHTHEGVHSVGVVSQLVGDVTFVADTGIQLSQVGQQIKIKNTGGTGAYVQEVPTGTVNGTNTVFTLSQTPFDPNSLLFFVDQNPLEKTQYSLAGAVVTIVDSAVVPVVGQTVYAVYVYNAGAPLGSGSTPSRWTPYGTVATPITVNPASGLTSTADDRQLFFIQSQGGAQTMSAATQVSAGANVGQEMQLIGTSDANCTTFLDGNGLSLNGSWTAKNRSVITLTWDGVVWCESSRR